MENEDILVTVICITYNHELYIRSALEGFIRQRTSFIFEVLVHDDASTDRTACIISEFQKKHPLIIKPIYQQENQYSKKVNIIESILMPLVQGKYIALCEGDDYWLVDDKLEMQVKYLEAHSECAMTCHNSFRFDCETEQYYKENPVDHEGIVSAVDLILQPKDTCIATSSMVCRSSLYSAIPSFFCDAPVGDFPLRLYLMSKGSIYYFDRAMSVYRYKCPNSWTSNRSTKSDIEFFTRMIKFFDEFSAYTKKKYDHLIRNVIERYEYTLFVLNNKKIDAIRHIYFKGQPLKRRIKMLVVLFFPNIAKMKRLLTKYLKND